MKKKKIEKEEKRQSKIWLFIKKLLVVFISGFIVVMFFLEEPGLKAFAPVLLGLYIVWVFLFWIKQYKKQTRKFLIVLILLYGLPSMVLSYRAERFTKYTKEDHKDELNAFLSDVTYANREKCFEHYEDEMLGMKNNVALSGAEISQNYFNKIDGMKIYRDKEKQNLVTEKDGKEIFSTQEKVGEIIADSEQAFFINLDQGKQIDRLDLTTKKTAAVLKERTEQFAVLGDDLIVLTSKGDLYRLHWKEGKKEKLADHIQGFFVGKKLFVQNSTQILSISYDGKEKVLLEEQAYLRGYKNGKIYFISLDSKKEQNVLYERDLNEEDGESKKSEVKVQEIY